MAFLSVCINTCDRPKYLWYLLASLCVQTHKDFEVIIVDDGDKPCEHNPHVRAGIGGLENADVRVTVHKNEKKLGLAASRNVACDLASSGLVVKLDDDHYCDAECLRQLDLSIKEYPDAGCIGMVFPFIRNGVMVRMDWPDVFGDTDVDGWEEQQQCLYPPLAPDVIPAKTVRGLMLYRKDPEIRHDERLSPISHREDTIFTTEYLRRGYQNYVCVRAIAWHLYAKAGGCREFSAADAGRQRQEDEEIYRKYIQ
jgi:glycosyltransferase involved in cell wall biosynthesis